MNNLRGSWVYAAALLVWGRAMRYQRHARQRFCPLQGIYVTQYLPNAPVDVKMVAQQFNAAMGDIS